MATIGQALTAPESGWRRYDDTDSRIRYNGTWTRYTETSNYNSSRIISTTIGNSISFKFYGTKLRLLAFTDSTAYGNSHNIQIDNNSLETFSEKIGTQQYQTLVYEKTGLSLGIHIVTITHNSSTYLGLDAIDIDSTGYLVHPTLNQVSDINAMQVGDCIPCRYTTIASGKTGYFSELGTCIANEIPITGTAAPDGLFYLIKTDKGTLIADRVIQTNISWDALNSVKFIDGIGFGLKINNSSITALSDKTGYGTTSPQKLFDNILTNDSTNNGFYINTGSLPHYIGFFLNSAYPLYKIRYYTYSGSYQPYTFTIEGSNDATSPTNGTWTILKSYTALPALAQNVWGEYIINNTVPYKAYRLKITVTDGGSSIQFLLNELELIPFEKGVIRSITGGVAYIDSSGNPSLTNQNLGAWSSINEWDTYIIKSNLNGKITAGDDNIWRYKTINSWAKETNINGTWNDGKSNTYSMTNAMRISRGYAWLTQWLDINPCLSSCIDAKVGFRPVVNYIESDIASEVIY